MDSIIARFTLKDGGTITETFSNSIELDTYYEDNKYLFSNVETEYKEAKKEEK